MRTANIMLRCSTTTILVERIAIEHSSSIHDGKMYALQLSDFARSRLNFNSSDVPLCFEAARYLG